MSSTAIAHRLAVAVGVSASIFLGCSYGTPNLAAYAYPIHSSDDAWTVYVGPLEASSEDLTTVVTSASIVNLADPAQQAVIPMKVAVMPGPSCTTGRANCPYVNRFTLRIPDHLQQGAYAITLQAYDGVSSPPTLAFHTRPATDAEAVLVVHDLTLQAYNSFGGESLYVPKSDYADGEECVGLGRPLVGDNVTRAHDLIGLMQHLSRIGLKYDILTQAQFHADPGRIDAYKIFIIGGHDEYWTRTMRIRLESWVRAGGNLLNFSGNSLWWQVALRNNDRICLDRSGESPDTGGFTTKGLPSQGVIGVHFDFGGYFTDDEVPDRLKKFYRRYVVITSDHYAFAGVDISRMDTFAIESPTINHATEVDGLPLDTQLALLTGQIEFESTEMKSYPAGISVVALTPASRNGLRNGAIASFDLGKGHVFSAALTAWGGALAAGNPIPRTITTNAVIYALRRQGFEP